MLRNVRLWDYRIARETYQQLQSFVPYYVFNDVDVDRYPEEDELQQVLVSARELDLSGLQQNAQNWTNQHLSYTHGYAAVVSPINEATGQGLPVFSVSESHRTRLARKRSSNLEFISASGTSIGSRSILACKRLTESPEIRLRLSIPVWRKAQ